MSPTTTGIRVTVRHEDELNPSDQACISDLLQAVFQGYPAGRTSFPQPPHLRVLAWETQDLVGHCGGAIRQIAIGDGSFMVMGVADLCVLPDFQGRGLARLLLHRLETVATERGLDFLVAMSGESSFFAATGFSGVPVRAVWLSYLNGRSLGLCRRRLDDSVFVKPLAGRAWPSGELDLLGPMF